jgi:hypothetical protein
VISGPNIGSCFAPKNISLPDLVYNIKDSSGKQVFGASQLADQPAPLHTSEGVVTIPYTFESWRLYYCRGCIWNTFQSH